MKGLINLPELQHLQRVSQHEFRVALIALVGVLLFGVLKGVLLAAIASLVLLIRLAAHPTTVLLGRIRGTDQFSNVERHPENQLIPGILIYRINSGIVYFNVDNIQQDFFKRLFQQEVPVQLVIFDLSSSPLIDTPAARWFQTFYQQLTTQGIALRIVNANGIVRDRLRAERLETITGFLDRSASIESVVTEFTVDNS